MFTISNVPRRLWGTELAASRVWSVIPGGRVAREGNIVGEISRPKLWDPGGRRGCSSRRKMLGCVRKLGKLGSEIHRILTRFQSLYRPFLRVDLTITMPGLLDVGSIQNGLYIASAGSLSEQKVGHRLDWGGRKCHCLLLIL